MSSSAILYLISFYAAIGGVDPMVARAVASQESNLNPKAVGALGEVGLFQIRPEYEKKFTKLELFDVTTNIRVGIAMLKRAKDTCVHRKHLDYLVCFNGGNEMAKRIKYPSVFPYVLQIKKRIASYK